MPNRVVLDTDVPVPRRDGTVIRADVYRPPGGGRHPVLVHRTPYDKRVSQSYWYAPPSWYAAQGYAVVVEDVRGTGRSEGTFTPLTHEAPDGVDCVRWAAEQSWADGTVGWYGYSYCGVAQLLAAGADDVPLTAVVPALALPRLGEGCLRQNGVLNLAFVVSWAVELGALPITYGAGAEPLPALTAEALRQLVQVPADQLLASADDVSRAWLTSWLTGDDGDPYWSTVGDDIAYDAIDATALHLGGWYDTFRAGTVEHFRATADGRRGRGRNYLLMAPWTHQPVKAAAVPPPLTRARPAAWHIDALQLAFFDHALRGAPYEHPPVRLELINSPDVYSGAAWPPPEATVTAWHLASSGRANSVAGDGTLDTHAAGEPDHLVYNHADPVPSVGGDDCCAPLLRTMGGRDQRQVEARRDVLVYTSAPFERACTVAGDVDVVLYTAPVSSVTQWVCRLCLVTGDVSVNLCEGVTRTTGAAGDVEAVSVRLGPTGFRVEPGQRLRLQVTGGSHPRWQALHGPDGKPDVTRAVVLHDPEHPSALNLPMLP